MPAIKIEIDDRPVLDTLNRVIEAGRSPGPALRAIRMVLLSTAEANFAAESGPTGPWPALAQATQKDRAKRGKWPGQKLQDSGRLAASVAAGAGSDNEAAWISTNAIYAAIHQLGGSIEKAAQSRLVRHRTDAKGNLLTSAALGGHGLIFAKDSHQRAVGRWFEQGAHKINIPPRPYLPVTHDGRLQDGLEDEILGVLQKHLLG